MEEMKNNGTVGGMSVFGDFLKINPFSRFFSKARHEEDIKDRQISTNSQGVSQQELTYGSHGMSTMGQSTPEGGYNVLQIQFDQFFQYKSSRVSKYREMSYYPEISDALDKICDEAIMEDEHGDMLSLGITKEIPDHINDEIRKNWDHVLNEVFSIRETAWDLFRKFMIEGEVFIELVLDDNGHNIIAFKVLPSFTMYPIYIHDEIRGYIQSISDQLLNNLNQTVATQNLNRVDEDTVFDRDQVIYVNFGEYGANKYDIRGFLEAAVRPYNQLKNLEDATVVNKIVRAPSRRIWNIDVGKMTKTRGEEYVKGMMQRFRKRIRYDSVTGAMDASENFLSMIEDYWFPKGADGNGGTTVDTVDGNAAFSDMDDVKYFRMKLYDALKLPSSRWRSVEAPSVYVAGKSNEVTREEITFSKFVNRNTNKFKYVFLDALITQLRLQGFEEKYLDYSMYNVKFTKSNMFELYKELEVLGSRLEILGTCDAYVYKPDSNPGGYFASDFVMKRYFMMSDEEFNENEKMLIKAKATAPTQQMGMGGDEMGGDMGGGGTEVSLSTGEEVPMGGADTPAEAPAEENMGGTEDTGGAESFNYAIKNSKSTLILSEYANAINRK